MGRGSQRRCARPLNLPGLSFVHPDLKGPAGVVLRKQTTPHLLPPRQATAVRRGARRPPGHPRTEPTEATFRSEPEGHWRLWTQTTSVPDHQRSLQAD
jgi:hypothetical protein